MWTIKTRVGIRERPVEERVVRESGGNERTGGAQGGINETRVHAGRGIKGRNGLKLRGKTLLGETKA